MNVLVTGGTSGQRPRHGEGAGDAGAAVALTGRSGERARAVAAGLSGALGVELDVRSESSVAVASATSSRRA